MASLPPTRHTVASLPQMTMNMAEKEEQNGIQELYQGTYRIKSARATWCNYNEGLYFITICTAGKRHFFGEIEDAEMLFTEIGKYAQYCISQIEQLHQNVIVPYFVVMPNHVHLIISLTTDMPHTTGAVETSQCGVSTKPITLWRLYEPCHIVAFLPNRRHTVASLPQTVTLWRLYETRHRESRGQFFDF